MSDLARTAPAFVEMAHEIVYASVATVDGEGRPRSRVLHPYWEWDGASLVGWVATGRTPAKQAHLEANPHVSVNYWSPSQDTCVAECVASWRDDPESRQHVWDLFSNAPEPVGYDPRTNPSWTGPEVDAFRVLRLEPWLLRVFPGTMLLQGTGNILTWASSTPS